MQNILARFLKQSSHYSIAQILILASSLISFPILTRVFSPADYGLMNLIATTLIILVALAKGGLQHGVVRDFDAYNSSEGGNRDGLKTFIASGLWGGIVLALGLTLIWLFGNLLAAKFNFVDGRISTLIAVSSGLVFFRAAESLLLAFWRAEQETAVLNFYRVLSRYLNLGLILVFLFWVSGTLEAFYAAQALAMALSFGFMLRWRIKRSSPNPVKFSPNVFKATLLYGAPLIGFELGSVLMNSADKYLLQIFLNLEAVGYYSAAYNLTDYVKDVAVLPLATAVVPVYMRIWAQQGEAETHRFLQNALKTYLFLAVPLAFGCIAVKVDLISVIASTKFQQGHVIMPWIIFGMLANGALPILAAGLYIHKKTGALTMLLAVVIVLNVGLSTALIPLLGLEGAAIAKLLSYLVLAVWAKKRAGKSLHFQFPWPTLLNAGLAGAAMWFFLEQISFSTPLWSLAVEIVLGASIYFAILALIDKDFLRNVTRVFRNQAGKMFS